MSAATAAVLLAFVFDDAVPTSALALLLAAARVSLRSGLLLLPSAAALELDTTAYLRAPFVSATAAMCVHAFMLDVDARLSVVVSPAHTALRHSHVRTGSPTGNPSNVRADPRP